MRVGVAEAAGPAAGTGLAAYFVRAGERGEGDGHTETGRTAWESPDRQHYTWPKQTGAISAIFSSHGKAVKGEL